jgi:hypothetical protein
MTTRSLPVRAIRLYLDEDASHHALVQGLRARRFDLVTTFEAGRSGADDEDQLVFAARDGRVVYTFNAGDFARLHAEFLRSGRSHAGILTVPRQRYTIGEQIKRLSAFLYSVPAEAMVNRIEYL